MISFPATITCDNPDCRYSEEIQLRVSPGFFLEPATLCVFNWPQGTWQEVYLNAKGFRYACSPKCKEQLITAS